MNSAADSHGSAWPVVYSVPGSGSIRAYRYRLLILAGLWMVCFGAAVTGYLLDAPTRFLVRPEEPHAGHDSLSSFARNVLAESGVSVLLLALLASSTGALLTSFFPLAFQPGAVLQSCFLRNRSQCQRTDCGRLSFALESDQSGRTLF